MKLLAILAILALSSCASVITPQHLCPESNLPLCEDPKCNVYFCKPEQPTVDTVAL